MTYTITNLGPGIALDINDDGNVVGASADGGWYYDPAFSEPFSRRILRGMKLDRGGGNFFFFTAHSATSIWDSGAIFGDFWFIANDPSSSRQFSWIPGNEFAQEGMPGHGPATRRTESNGRRVGTFLDKDGITYHASMTENLVRHDLNYLVSAPGWIMESANAINSHGQIVGSGTFSGKQMAFLLTPVADRVDKIESYAGFHINAKAGTTVEIWAQDTEWDGQWRQIDTHRCLTNNDLWIDTTSPRRRGRDYQVKEQI